jgi:hypothetical protein
MAGRAATAIKPASFVGLVDAVGNTPPPSLAPPQNGAQPPTLSPVQVRILTWFVFFGCLFFSALGAVASFLILGSTISVYKMWVFSVIIAVGMISLSYVQKYSNLASRTSFTPIDAISYAIQGFLWPSTWPSLAQAIGISSTIAPPSSPSPGHADNLFGLFMSMLS